MWPFSKLSGRGWGWSWCRRPFLNLAIPKHDEQGSIAKSEALRVGSWKFWLQTWNLEVRSASIRRFTWGLFLALVVASAATATTSTTATNTDDDYYYDGNGNVDANVNVDQREPSQNNIYDAEIERGRRFLLPLLLAVSLNSRASEHIKVYPASG